MRLLFVRLFTVLSVAAISVGVGMIAADVRTEHFGIGAAFLAGGAATWFLVARNS